MDRKNVLLALLLAHVAAPVSAAEALPDLAKGITSFGSAVIGKHLYVYGGHFGRAHHYSNKSQSNELSRLDLSRPRKWEVIGKGPRLQGLAMVAHKGKLYRVGGFTAHNKEDDPHDLRSVASFASFDPQARKWTKLSDLPEPRSSHDAVVIGDKLYVVGGWNLGKKSVWHKTGWVADLSQVKITWLPLPTPPFTRRAVSLGRLGKKLVVVGGMRQKGGPTTRVDTYDPQSKKWLPGPSLVNASGKQGRFARMEGFGSSAFAVGDSLFVSTFSGSVQALRPAATKWQVIGKLKEDRFFHRMVTYQSRLLILGGASMTEGKRTGLETVKVK